MNKRIWDKFLTERDKAVFAAGGFGARAGFGKRPALLVIDVNWAFCGERPEPILESIKRWRTSCGEESWVALKHIKSLIEAARAKELPVIYTTGERRPDNWDAGSWRWKSTRGDEASGTAHSDIDSDEIVTTIAPGPKDIVIKKQKPSGFGVQRRAKVPGIGGRFTTASIFGNRQGDIREICPSGTDRL
jgi:hypothetical protein